MPLLSALGVSTVLQNSILLTFGGRARSSPLNLEMVPSVRVAGAILPGSGLVVLGVALLIAAGMIMFLRLTRAGLAIRMVATDREAAEVLGIRSTRVISATFATSAAIASCGGILIGAIHDLTPTMGTLLGFKAFAACVLGGMRNLSGSMLAGVALGVLESLAGGYLGSDYRDAYVFFVLIAALIISPQGLFGGRLARIA